MKGRTSKKGITVPIVVMNPEQHSYETIIEYNLEPEIYSFRVLELFYEAVQKSGYDKKYPIHIKLETGMHRLGFKDFELDQLSETLIQKCKSSEYFQSSFFFRYA
jgi:alanine racemase